MKTRLSALLVALALSTQAKITSTLDTGADGQSGNALTEFISIFDSAQPI